MVNMVNWRRRLLRVSNRSFLAFIFFFSMFTTCLYFIYAAPGIGECKHGSWMEPPGEPAERRRARRVRLSSSRDAASCGYRQDAVVIKATL